MMCRRLFLLLAAFLLPAAHGAEPSWPAKPLHFIVPFPAGSAVDGLARVIGQRMGVRLGQQLVVDNRVGGSGSVGAVAVARAAPDGYTIGLVTASTHAVAVSLNPNLPYDPLKDFAPIGMIGDSPYVVVIYPGVPATNVTELVALAAAKPRALNYASVGPASLANLAVELFSHAAQIQLTHVPYRSSAQALLDLIEGRIQLQFGTLGPTIPYIRDGKVRALAVTSAKRVSTLPNIPTLREAGIADYEASLWTALMAPPATPTAIIDRLNRELNAFLQSADGRASLIALGVEPEAGAPSAVQARISRDIEKWRGVVKRAGITAE
jgi:tripartite-type tricarboxylate transporter receptor subunit TctC